MSKTKTALPQLAQYSFEQVQALRTNCEKELRARQTKQEAAFAGDPLYKAIVALAKQIQKSSYIAVRNVPLQLLIKRAEIEFDWDWGGEVVPEVVDVQNESKIIDKALFAILAVQERMTLISAKIKEMDGKIKELAKKHKVDAQIVWDSLNL